MGLITKTVKMKWGARNKNHFVNLGYEFTKMGDEFEVKIDDLLTNSVVKVKCICDNCKKELNWKLQDYRKCVKENGNTYCNKCAMNLYGTQKRNENLIKNKKSKSFEEWCISNNRQDVLNRWDYELNDCKPNEVCYSSSKKYWFKCDKHFEHHSELKSIHRFVSGQEGSIECNQCNSIAQWILDKFPNKNLEDIWDYDKNIISPWEIPHCSTTKVWIKCQDVDYHGSYERSCNEIVWNKGCPYCNPNSGNVHPKDSMGQYIIDNFGEDFLNKIWSDKNNKSYFEYALHSDKKVWWKCAEGKHEEYCRCVDKSNRFNFNCPQWVKEKTESLGEESTRLYLETLGYTILHEHKCTLKPQNPKTKHYMRYDNEIKELRLIIEVHGYQHYDYSFYKAFNKCSREEAEQQLHYQQVKDRYKRIYAIQHGYHYLEIPYTAFDKQETYKKLIDNKINEIKQIKNNQQEESA